MQDLNAGLKLCIHCRDESLNRQGQAEARGKLARQSRLNCGATVVLERVGKLIVSSSKPHGFQVDIYLTYLSRLQVFLL